MEQILVTGGTGRLGRGVVGRLVDSGRAVRIASRRPTPQGRTPYAWATVDYRSGEGLDEALIGVDAVIHCVGGSDGGVDRQVVEAARRAGTPHLTYISIVGVDRVPFGYYHAKLAAERIIEASGVPWTILRATQFHDLVRVLLATLARSPVMLVPDVSVQPVDVSEVAERLVELATGEPAGRAADMAGPEVRSVRDLAGAYLRATGRRRPIVPMRFPGKAFRGYRAGGHLAPEHAVGHITFEQYLAAHPAPAALSYRGKR